MSQIVIRPVHKRVVGSCNLIDPELRSNARQSTNSALPVIYVASYCTNTDPRSGPYEFDENKTAALGFKYRRQSHDCVITWWGGTSTVLLQELARVMVLQAILEGRKRVECANEQEGSRIILNKSLQYADYSYEGTHEDYTDQMEDVKIFAHVWCEDGIPQLSNNTTVYLLNSGEVKRVKVSKGKTKLEGSGVKFYYEKNLELYEKDRDLYKVRKNSSKTFAEEIREANQVVRSMKNVKIIENWEQIPDYVFDSSNKGGTVAGALKPKIKWDPETMQSNRK